MRELKIGRGTGNDIIISDPTVSRTHAILIISDSGYSIKDLNSGNGTYINGMRVSGVSTLANNDILKVGNVVVPWKNYLVLNNVPEIEKPNEALMGNQNQTSSISSNSNAPKMNIPSANAALVLGIIGLILFWIPLISLILCILAIAQGAKSNREFRANPGKYREGSRSSGNAGKIMGIIGAILTFLYWLFIFVVFLLAMDEYDNSYYDDNYNYNDYDYDGVIDSEDDDIDGDGFYNWEDCCDYDEYNY